MSNTNYDIVAVTHRIVDAATQVLPDILAPIGGFATDFSSEVVAPTKRTVGVPHITTGSAVLTDPSSFESGDTTTTEVSVVMHQYSAPFHVTNQELTEGHRLMTKAAYKANMLAAKIMAICTATMVTTNFGTAAVGAYGTFTGATLADQTALVKSMDLTAILNENYWAKVLPSDLNGFRILTEGGYGFNRIAKQTAWTGADASIVGFVCDRNAIAVAAGIPETSAAIDMIASEIITLEKLGLSVQMNLWANTATRALWASYDVMFGAAKLNGAAGKILVA